MTGIPVEDIQGSYAGALGIPQFMPSNYLKFGQDADEDGKVNLFDSHPDAIASAARYLQNFGWIEEDVPLVQGVISKESKALRKLDALQDWKVLRSQEDLKSLGVAPAVCKQSADGSYLVIVKPNAKPLSKQVYLTSHNWKVITRYNTSPRYALAVANLANKLEHRFNEQYSNSD